MYTTKHNKKGAVRGRPLYLSIYCTCVMCFVLLSYMLCIYIIIYIYIYIEIYGGVSLMMGNRRRKMPGQFGTIGFLNDVGHECCFGNVISSLI